MLLDGERKADSPLAHQGYILETWPSHSRMLWQEKYNSFFQPRGAEVKSPGGHGRRDGGYHSSRVYLRWYKGYPTDFMVRRVVDEAKAAAAEKRARRV